MSGWEGCGRRPSLWDRGLPRGPSAARTATCARPSRGGPRPTHPEPLLKKTRGSKTTARTLSQPALPNRSRRLPAGRPASSRPLSVPRAPPLFTPRSPSSQRERAQLTPESLPCALEPEGRWSRCLERGSPAPPPRHITARAASLLLLPRSVKKRNLPERAGPSQRPPPTGA